LVSRHFWLMQVIITQPTIPIAARVRDDMPVPEEVIAACTKLGMTYRGMANFWMSRQVLISEGKAAPKKPLKSLCSQQFNHMLLPLSHMLGTSAWCLRKVRVKSPCLRRLINWLPRYIHNPSSVLREAVIAKVRSMNETKKMASSVGEYPYLPGSRYC
jgi:hypothetical protein